MVGARDYTNQDTGSTLGQDLQILDGIASWCGALHGSMPLDEALVSIANSLGAEIAVITRDGRSDGKPRVVAEFDSRADDADCEKLRRGYATDVLGKFYNKVRSGTIWFLSDDQGEDVSQGLKNWQSNRGIGDIIVVSLESNGIQHDYLEFHFAKQLGDQAKLETERVLPTLVRAWTKRQTGLVTQAQMDVRMVRAREAAKASRIQPEEAILGVSNPAKLSRAEFRVCLLLSRGLSVKATTEELGLSEATIRSHLRSIYSKTDTSGLAELVYRILSNTKDQHRIGTATG